MPFSISNGRILDPDGVPFIARGLGVYETDVADKILTLFPGINFIRCPTPSFLPVSFWDGFIATMSAHKVVCMPEWHPWPMLPAQSGQALAAEAAWYGAMAAHYKDNPYVWLETNNEPQGGQLTPEHVACYTAIRAAGNNNPVLFMGGIGGGNPGQTGVAVLNAGQYSAMRNIIWDLHLYGWSSNDSTDQNAVNASLTGNATNSGVRSLAAIRSADGVIPVIVAEFGPSTDGQSDDANGNQVIETATNWAVTSGLTSGYCGWAWASSAANGLQSGGVLTRWGQQLAAAIKATAGTLGGGSEIAASPGTWVDGTAGGMAYKVLLPDHYDAAIAYPVVLYLHQLDMGMDIPDLMIQINPWFNTAAFRAAHPAIVVVPFLDQTADPSGNTVNFGGVSSSVTAGRDAALAVLGVVLAKYKTDASRIYVTGNSMGGIGSWEIIAFRPDQFAAAMPLAGANYCRDVNTTCVALRTKPICAFHGALDTSVPLAWDRAMYARMQAIGGAMLYTEMAGIGHDVWDSVYTDMSNFDWLFDQSLTGVSPPMATQSPDNTVVMAGSSAAITDAGGSAWTITSGGQVAVNGVPDTTTGGVTELAYVGGTVWQKNATLWWGKVAATAGWLPATGTATSPIPVVVLPPIDAPTHITVAAKMDAALALIAAAMADLATLKP